MGTKIYNSDVTKELREGARIMTSSDTTPTELAEKVVPVMEVNPKLLRINNIVKNIITSTTGAVTLYTTPADREFYLTSVFLTYAKDVTSDGSDCYISITLASGLGEVILANAGITLTAATGGVSQSFENPILLKKGTAISIVGNTSVGVFRKSGGITGYTVENINA